MNAAARQPGRFTGRHMTIILVAFFGVVITVNVFMARMAVGTFGGTVVDNSYVASQKFNGWLEAGRRQRDLGWQPLVARGADGVVALSLNDAAGAPLSGARVDVMAEHPLGRLPARRFTAAEAASGRYPFTQLPPGRWLLRLSITRGDGEALRLIRTVE